MSKAERKEEGLVKKETGILATYSPSADAVYFRLSSSQRSLNFDNSVELTAELIIDLGSKGEIIGLELLSAKKNVAGIIDLAKFRSYREDIRKGRTSPKLLAQLVEKLISTDHQVSQKPITHLVLESLRSYQHFKERVLCQIPTVKKSRLD